MGKELDSLADIVSFGVAPAIILIKLIHSSLYTQDPFLSSNAIMAILTYIPALMPVCAGLRLAKFNIDTTQTTSFRGLPTPANAIGVISIVIAAHYSGMSTLKILYCRTLVTYNLYNYPFTPDGYQDPFTIPEDLLCQL